MFGWGLKLLVEPLGPSAYGEVFTWQEDMWGGAMATTIVAPYSDAPPARRPNDTPCFRPTRNSDAFGGGLAAAPDFLPHARRRYALVDDALGPQETLPVNDNRNPPIAPAYIADLRRLVARAFAETTPVARAPVPGGNLRERLRAGSPAADAPLVVCANYTGPEAAVVVPAPEYWAWALPHRLWIVGPLLEIAKADLPEDERRNTEQRLLHTHDVTYLQVPLPPDLLNTIRRAAGPPAESLPAWLDLAREQIVGAPMADAAAAARRRLRIDALRHGAAGLWSESAVAVAELMIDLLLVAHACNTDLGSAISAAPLHGGSVALAFQAADEREDTAFEGALHTLRAPLPEEDIPGGERAQILLFASRRSPIWREGILDPAGGEDPTAALGSTSVRVESPLSAEPPEPTARETYTRIREAVERALLGQPGLSRRLALIGTAHIFGVRRQRVLLAGPTGSGKTHSATVLADVLERPLVQVDMGDVTTTGWRGVDIPDLLDMLAERSKDGLDGSVLHLDEIDKVRLDGELHGNSRQASVGLMTSLLALLDGRAVTPDDGRDQLQTDGVLVIGTGAFDGRFIHRPPSNRDLVEWGWLPEMAARWTERLCLAPVDRRAAMDLLRRSNRSVQVRLAPLTSALGVEIEVSAEALAYVVDLWLRSGTDFRTASEWLVEAARRRLVKAIEEGGAEAITLAPDDLAIPPPPQE